MAADGDLEDPFVHARFMNGVTMSAHVTTVPQSHATVHLRVLGIVDIFFNLLHTFLKLMD